MPHPPGAFAVDGVGDDRRRRPEAPRAEKAKELPRKFVLAATPDRVLAFGADSHSRGESTDSVMHVTIHPGELASWSRGEVSMRPDDGGMNQNATLVLAGTDVPCSVPDGDAEDAFRELIRVLGATT